MTADSLAATAGVLLSLAFSYIPGLAEWYVLKADPVKRLIMLGLLLLVGLGAFGLACGGLAADFGLPVTCDKTGAIALLRSFSVAAIANQTAYALTPYSQSRKAGRSIRAQ